MPKPTPMDALKATYGQARQGREAAEALQPLLALLEPAGGAERWPNCRGLLEAILEAQHRTLEAIETLSARLDERGPHDALADPPAFPASPVAVRTSQPVSRPPVLPPARPRHRACAPAWQNRLGAHSRQCREMGERFRRLVEDMLQSCAPAKPARTESAPAPRPTPLSERDALRAELRAEMPARQQSKPSRKPARGVQREISDLQVTPENKGLARSPIAGTGQPRTLSAPNFGPRRRRSRGDVGTRRLGPDDETYYGPKM